MAKFYVFLLAVCISFQIYAQNWVNISSQTPKPVKIKLVSGNIQSSSFTVELNGYTTQDVQTPQGVQQIISLQNTTPILQAGAPDLPKVTTSMIIPDNQQMEVVVTYSNYIDYPNVEIAPSKGNFTRDIEPASVPYVYGTAYNQNQFFPGTLVELKEPYILRDFRGQTVVTYPFQYNPVTKVLRVYSNLSVSLHTNTAPVANPLVRNEALSVIDKEFSRIYSSQFLNYTSNHKYTALNEHGKMLIICYDAYMTAMQPFVNWKNDEGIPTEMVSVTAAGSTAAAIKTYVTNYYNTNGLTFLLLVGDALCPTFTVAGGGSDPSYGYIVGSDHYQEIFVGRFSAESPAHVITQVNRTLSYEKTPTTSIGKFNSCVGIGSDQGPGDDNEYDYQHERRMLDSLTNYTYLTRAELFDGSQGGADVAGNATQAQVTTEVNKGAGIITYCGHGSDVSWGTTGFSNTEVGALTNTTMWPFIWSVACVNGNFTATNPCFAEAWLRATNGALPTGAVATLMSTINQSWNPPMEAEDEMVNLLVESNTNNIKRTFGGLSVNGIFKMNDTYSDFNMTDTWTIFGDPSLMVRTDNPHTMTVTHNPSTVMGATSLVVNCNAPNGFVCLTKFHQIIGTASVVAGVANVSFSSLNTTDSILITATAYNYIPYQMKIPVFTGVGISETQADASFSIYPNPAHQQQVTFAVNNTSSPISIKIYSVMGSLIDVVEDKTLTGTSALYHYNTANLSSGIYYVEMNAGDKKSVKKLVITE